MSHEAAEAVAVKLRVSEDEVRRLTLSPHTPAPALAARLAALLPDPADEPASFEVRAADGCWQPLGAGWAAAARAKAGAGHEADAPVQVRLAPRAPARATGRAAMVPPVHQGPWPRAEPPAFEVITQPRSAPGSRRGSADSWTLVEDEAAAEPRAAAAPAADPAPLVVNLTVNGAAQTLTNPPPTLMLAEYLRRGLGLTGTKVGCGECGCGACTVVLTDAGGAAVTANSCIRPVCSLDGVAVTTTEGLGSPQAGLSKEQDALAKNSASQCGYCSPGMTMSLHGLLLAHPKPTAEQLEGAFDGNLCRCTGYRPILRAAHSFAPSRAPAADIEDVVAPNGARKPCGGAGGAASKCGGGGACGGSGKCHTAAKHARASVDPATGVAWVEAHTLKDVAAALAGAAAGAAVQLVHGNTGRSVAKYYADLPEPALYVNVAGLAEAQGVHVPTKAGDKMTVGAAASLTELRAALESAASVPGYEYAAQLAWHLGHVANHQVRNMSSWAGNLAMAAAHPGFPSDLRTILAAAGAFVGAANVLTGDKFQLPVSEAVARGPLARGVVLLQLYLRPVASAGGPQFFRTFKVAERAQNAHALVNAGFLLQLDAGGKVSTFSGCFGGLTSGLVFATDAAAALYGRALTADTLTAALPQLASDLKLPPDAPHPNRTLPPQAYRVSAATALFYKFFVGAMAGTSPHSVPPRLASAWEVPQRPVSSGTETFTADGKEAPVGQPLPKLEAGAQVSGACRYTDDQPTPARGLEAAYVLATRGPAAIKSVDAAAALAMPGVVALVTAHDVAALGGSNNCGAFPGDEQIFAEALAAYPGQPVALVCAETRPQAEAAARAVVVTYGPPPAGAPAKPIVTAAQAVAAGSYLKNNQYASHIGSLKRGDAAGALKSAPHVFKGSLSTPASSHFFMETQACLVEPSGDGRYVVWASTQGPSTVRGRLQAVLGLPASALEVQTTRSGGAFGGKITRIVPVAAACLVASARLGRAVRMQLSRRDDLRNMGKRNPFVFDYQAGFGDKGEIQAYVADVQTVGGWSYDLSMGTSDGAMLWADNVYRMPNWAFTAEVLRTTAPPHTAARAPGAMNAMFFTESVMERAAWELGLDPDAVREANFYADGDTTPYGQKIATASTLAATWAKLHDSAGLAARRKEVAAFNATNRWRKRGVRATPVKYGIEFAGYQVGVRVAVAVDGTITASTSGTEMGQGLNTKVAQAVAMELGVDVSAVTFTSCSTRDFPWFGDTGGSGTSEACVGAALLACAKINEAMAPARKQYPKGTWQQLVQAATYSGACLTQQGWYAGKGAPGANAVFNYFVWCVAATEVELDVLTGATEVRRVDIVYDSGLSLNYAVDIGQVEGAFVQALGFFFTEKVVNDVTTGRVVNDGTWDYKPPSSMDTPVVFNVTCAGQANAVAGAILGSKASGEPPLMLAASAFFALKDCVRAARKDAGLGDAYFDLAVPATPDVAQLACGVTADQLTV